MPSASCAQAGAVAPFPRQAGAAAGVLGFLTMALAALVGWWIGVSNNATVYPLAFTVGVFGLAAFNVSTRTKQIGTRRAVGARRFDIVRYFLVENWMVTTVGVFAGCALALLLGYWLSTAFELPRLKLYCLLAGVVGLWAVGLAAALVPARRASLVSPAVATRTV